MNRSFSTVKGVDRVFIIGLIVWVLLQMSRFIALTLIDTINTGAESEAWRYPAYLDLFAAVLALPLIWAIVKHRGLLTWVSAVVYLAISIVDHVGNFVTTSFVGPPSIAEGMNPILVPAIQTGFDILFLALLFVPRFRKLFFRLDKTESQATTC